MSSPPRKPFAIAEPLRDRDLVRLYWPVALRPAFDPTCIAPMIMREGDGTSSCEWDDGMPAISADGTRTVTWSHRYERNVSIRFLDASTSRVVPGMAVTIARRVRVRRLKSVDFPALV